jgi:hypothetical protein
VITAISSGERTRREAAAGRPGRRRPAVVTVTVAAAALALAVTTATAGPAAAAAGVAAPPASGAAPAGTFGVSPAPGPSGHAPAYFSMTIGPGQSVAGVALVRNAGPATVTLKIGPSTGVTATNGGTAYTGAFGRCQGVACWVAGLPGAITLPGHSVERLRFTVRVPSGTRPGQYLAGISVASADRPGAVAVRSRGPAKVEAVIVETVTAGVAVTVGSLPQLAQRLVIPTVTGADEGPVARLVVGLHNAGRTFNSATGTAACGAGSRQRTFRAVAGVVLPGESAAIDVNAPGVPELSGIRCTVRLRYGRDQTAVWSGTVRFPAQSQPMVRTGPNSFASLPPSPGTPLWAWILGALVSAALVVAGANFGLRVRQARRLAAGGQAPGAAAAGVSDAAAPAVEGP